MKAQYQSKEGIKTLLEHNEELVHEVQSWLEMVRSLGDITLLCRYPLLIAPFGSLDISTGFWYIDGAGNTGPREQEVRWTSPDEIMEGQMIDG